jgi:hypothetical protein
LNVPPEEPDHLTPALVALAALALFVPLLAAATVLRFLPSWQVRLAVGTAALAATLPALCLGRRNSPPAPWAAGAALGLSALAVAVTAQSFDLANLVAAQVNTLPYVLIQPLAAALWVAGGALLLPPSGRPGLASLAARLACLAAAAALAAALFGAGGAGPLLPGAVWLVVKSLAAAGLVVAVERAWARLPAGRRAVAAWRILVPLGAANLIATIIAVGE